jgi:hypothetical protein
MKRLSQLCCMLIITGFVFGVMRLPAQMQDMPRVMVVVDEKIDDKDVTARKVAGKIESALLAKGYRLVDKAQFENVRARDLALGDISPVKAKELGRRFGAELIIAGGAQANFGEERETYGIKSVEYTADGEIKLVITDVGEILAVSSASAKKASQGKAQAASKALEDVGEQLAADIMVKLDKKMKEAKEQPTVIQLALLGVTDASLLKIEQELPSKVPMIDKMKLRYMEGDAAVLDVWIKGTIDELRKQFSGMADYKVESFTGSRIDVNTKVQGGKAKISYAVPSALEISEFNAENIFPAQYSTYSKNPIGRITIENSGKTDISNITVKVFIPTYMQMASEEKIALLKAGAKQTFPVSATLDKDKLLGVSEQTVTQVKAEISYRMGGEEKTRSITKPVTVYSKNAISWSKPLSVGAFVTYKDAAVENFSRYVIGNVKHDPTLYPSASRNFVNAMKVWEAVRAFSINYVTDPWVVAEGDVLDEVQFPRQTLAKKAGDCDDSSVLLAACLENIGVKTAIIGTADHVFIMFDAGVNKKNASRVSLNERDYVIRDNSVWIPLETTIINQPFAEAWRVGADGYYKTVDVKGKMDVTEVRKAWEVSPPANLASNEEVSKPPAAESITELTNTDFKTIALNGLQMLNEQVTALKAKNDDRSMNHAAMLLANAGKYEDAVALLKTLPTATAMNNLGNIYLLKGDSVNSYKSYTAAIKADAKDGGINLNMGLLKYVGGDHEGTVQSFADAVSKFPSQEKAYAELGIDNIIAEMGQTKAAEKGTVIDRTELQSLLFSALQDVAAKKDTRATSSRIRRGENRFVFGGRRGIDPTALSNIKDFLYWKF